VHRALGKDAAADGPDGADPRPQRRSLNAYLSDALTTKARGGPRDLDGDGRDGAVLNLNCSKAGGTPAGQFALASVVYTLRGRTLGSIGAVTPTQPLSFVSYAPAGLGRSPLKTIVERQPTR
jgi:hypothetical protein